MISSMMALEFHAPLAPVIACSQGSDHSAEYWTEEEHRGKPVMRWALTQILPLGGPRPLVQFYDTHEMIRIFLEATGQDQNQNDEVNGFLTDSWLRKIAVRDVLLSRLNDATL